MTDPSNPGPGKYNLPKDDRMNPVIRCKGTFGMAKKGGAQPKKTLEPGPGAYYIPSSVGNMPYYLRQEENRRRKKAH